ncbi:MAG: hypothetical protein KatS3mg121_1057 [Gammaproteobacteria bacterium]|nr:MAG: hypothetical protein KatS3mg121_1057 [Gammaproteobacteria bacterium]
MARPRPETLYRRAQAALAAGREQAAAADLAAALAAKPDFHAAREALIAVALRRGRIAEAERLVDEGLALAPDHLPYARLLAQWQLDRGDAAAARRVLERVMASADPALHAYYAAVLQRLGEWPEAVRHQLLAVEAEPARGAWWLALGWSLEQLQRRRAAAEAYRKGLACQDLTAELRTWAAGRLRSLEDTP